MEKLERFFRKLFTSIRICEHAETNTMMLWSLQPRTQLLPFVSKRISCINTQMIAAIRYLWRGFFA